MLGRRMKLLLKTIGCLRESLGVLGDGIRPHGRFRDMSGAEGLCGTGALDRPTRHDKGTDAVDKIRLDVA
jgi:hypothetical protein